MNIALTEHLEDLIERILKTGRYNNASEVVRAALRELEKKEFGDYLNPPLLPAGTLAKIYAREAKPTVTARPGASAVPLANGRRGESMGHLHVGRSSRRHPLTSRARGLQAGGEHSELFDSARRAAAGTW